MCLRVSLERVHLKLLYTRNDALAVIVLEIWNTKIDVGI